MANPKLRIFIIFFIGFLTGVNFVIFPALTPALTDAHIFGLSSGQFGNLFIPQVFCIIISCLSAPFLVNHWGLKKVLILGLILMLFSTGLLWSTSFYEGDNTVLFPILLGLVALMGLGFGFSITVLNPIVAVLLPGNKSSAILILQFLVGLGTSTSPFLMSLIGDVKYWMYLPAIIFAVFIIVFLLFCLIKFEFQSDSNNQRNFKLPARFWMFFAVIIFYGFIEGTFGSFGVVILKNMGLADHNATLGLSLFWGGIAINRLSFGIISKKKNLSNFYLYSSLLLGVFIFCLSLTINLSLIFLLMFIVGFFMGSLFPGTISWGSTEFPKYPVIVSGFLMASNQLGTGIVTNVLGYFSISNQVIFVTLSVVSLVIFCTLIFIKKKSKIQDAFAPN